MWELPFTISILTSNFTLYQVAIVVFVLNLVAIGFCVVYMFQGSRYYRRQVKLLEKQQKLDQSAEEPISEKGKSGRFTFMPTKSKFFAKDRPKSEEQDVEDQPVATVKSPTVALYRQALTPAIQEQEYPETKPESDLFTSSARLRMSFWKRDSMSKFEPMDSASLRGEAV